MVSRAAAAAPSGRTHGRYDARGNEQTAHLLMEVASDTSTVVIEHDIKFVREIASRITVLHKGAVLAEGLLEEIAQNDTVRNVYLAGRICDSRSSGLISDTAERRLQRCRPGNRRGRESMPVGRNGVGKTTF